MWGDDFHCLEVFFGGTIELQLDGQFFEGLGKGLGSGLMDAVTEVGKAILDDDDQPDDDDDEDEYS